MVREHGQDDPVLEKRQGQKIPVDAALIRAEGFERYEMIDQKPLGLLFLDNHSGGIPDLVECVCHPLKIQGTVDPDRAFDQFLLVFADLERRGDVNGEPQ